MIKEAAKKKEQDKKQQEASFMKDKGSNKS